MIIAPVARVRNELEKISMGRADLSWTSPGLVDSQATSFRP